MGVSVDRNDTPAASFYMERETWVQQAACLRVRPEMFFDEIDSATQSTKRRAIERAQEVCAGCPVRIECGAQAMRDEADAAEDGRYGFRAYMTPQQRTSIARRGGLKGRDPMRLVRGWDGKRPIPVVPEDGDNWSKHHTALARKVVRWLVEHVEIGETLPTQTQLCKTLSCSPGQLKRVLDALVQDGTLDGAPPSRYRNATTAAYVRRSSPRLIGWLPTHLRVPT